MTRVGSQRHRKKIRPGTEGNQDKLQLRQPVSSPSLKTGSPRIQRMVPSRPRRSDHPSLILLTHFCQSFVRSLKKAETTIKLRMSSRFIGLGKGTSCGFLVNTKMNLQVQSTDITNESQKQVIHPGCTDHGRQVVWTSTFCTMAPSACGPSVSNLFPIIHVAPRMLWWLLDIRNTCAPLY